MSSTFTIRCRQQAVFEMEGERRAFPVSAVQARMNDEVNVSVDVGTGAASIDGDYEVVMRFRTDIIIEEWIRDAESAIITEAGTDHTMLDWRIEAA